MASPKVFVATPCYGGQTTSAYCHSMFYAGQLAQRSGIELVLAHSSNESLITRARNRLVKLFLKTDCTHLFFVDADIGFKPHHILQIVSHDKEVVTAAYAKKGVHFDRLVGETIRSEDHARALATQYVINHVESVRQKHLENHNKIIQFTVEDGLLEIQDAGTGFMCIKREVIEQMIRAYPETAYTNDENNLKETWWALFDCVIENDAYLSEDYTFCRRWQKMGGKIWLDPMVVLDHVGTYTFGGIPQYFSEQPVR